MEKDIFQKLSDEWPSAIVARTAIEKFSGGLISAKHIANIDCLGQGPERITVGRKVAYSKAGLIAWMRDRSKN